jgi:hypothetical protein
MDTKSMDKLPMASEGHLVLEKELGIGFRSSDLVSFSAFRKRLPTIQTLPRIRNIRLLRQSRK